MYRLSYLNLWKRVLLIKRPMRHRIHADSHAYGNTHVHAQIIHVHILLMVEASAESTCNAQIELSKLVEKSFVQQETNDTIKSPMRHDTHEDSHTYGNTHVHAQIIHVHILHMVEGSAESTCNVLIELSNLVEKSFAQQATNDNSTQWRPALP